MEKHMLWNDRKERDTNISSVEEHGLSIILATLAFSRTLDEERFFVQWQKNK